MKFSGRPDVQVPHNGGDGSAGQSGSENHSGSVSNTSGSIVTGYRERSGSMETPGGPSSQREVQRKILLGEYNLNTSLVGENGRDFISKVGGWAGRWVGLLDVPGQGGVARKSEDACTYPSFEGSILTVFCEVLT